MTTTPLQIDEPEPTKQSAPLWRLAFRAGFLCASTFGAIALLRWILWSINPGDWESTLPAHWWHAHEMVFGFAMPVVAGFLLSAVATWTGLPGTTGTRLKILFGLWLLARLCLWLLPSALLLAWAAEMLFIALLMFELGSRVWAKRQTRNLLFLPILLLLAVLGSISFLAIEDPLFSTRLHYGALWLMTTLVVIIGGRVIPLFTGNRLGFKIAPLPKWLEMLAIGSTVIVGLATALWPTQVLSPWLQWLCFASFAVHLYRVFHWRGWKTFGVPLLWSMHLSYLCIPLTLFGLALTGTDPVATKNLIHLLAIGTVGGMILSMMSRVSLGHTGRPLDPPGGMAWAFALIFIAAAIRAFLPILAPSLTFWAWWISGGLWVLAFVIFTLRYFPILTRARADGKPG